MINFSEYDYNSDPFCEDDSRVSKLKWIIANQISPTDRTIILLYCELGSQRQVGKMLGVSASTVNIQLKRIRNQIKELCGIN